MAKVRQRKKVSVEPKKRRRRRPTILVLAVKATKLADDLAAKAAEARILARRLKAEAKRLHFQKKGLEARNRPRRQRRSRINPLDKAFRILSGRQSPMKLADLSLRVHGIKDAQLAINLAAKLRKDSRFLKAGFGKYTVKKKS